MPHIGIDRALGLVRGYCRGILQWYIGEVTGPVKEFQYGNIGFRGHGIFVLRPPPRVRGAAAVYRAP